MPASVQCFGHLGVREIGEPHRHAQLAAEFDGERHVLVTEPECEVGRIVRPTEKSLAQTIDRVAVLVSRDDSRPV